MVYVDYSTSVALPAHRRDKPDLVRWPPEELADVHHPKNDFLAFYCFTVRLEMKNDFFVMFLLFFLFPAVARKLNCYKFQKT